jgi:lysine 6-dehydrogenase
MAQTQFIVLGGGFVGGFIARTLAQDPACHVTLADRDQAVLERSSIKAPLSYNVANLADTAVLRKVVEEADVVVSAMPGRLGYRTLEAVLRAGKPCVDIAFFPENALKLDSMAKQRGIQAVVDCGVMPGLGGMLGLDLARHFETPLKLRILVGGLPVERCWPFEYKAPFSPSDVIEEYVRPARLKLNGEVVELPALSDVELLDWPGIGTLEAFNTDGLRTLLATLPFPTMIEKTLRYPGYAEKVRLLRELGFFGEEALELNGASVRPLDVASRLLFKAWSLEPGMREFTVMRVEAAGLRAGKTAWARYDLLDYTDESGEFSMARTTGWPAVLAARMLAGGRLRGFPPGVIAAERLAGDPTLFNELLAGIKAAGIKLEFSESTR